MAQILFFLAVLSEWALEIYQWMIIVAIVLTWVNPDPSNPIVRFLNRMTQPLWNWISGILPPALRLFAAYFSLLAVWFLRVFLPGVFTTLGEFAAERMAAGDVPVSLMGYFLLGLGVVLRNFFSFFTLLLLIWFFLTLVSPSINNPIVRTLYVLVDPFLAPIQRRLPRMRYDLSPLVAAGIFLLFNLIVVSALINQALQMTARGVPTIPGAQIF